MRVYEAAKLLGKNSKELADELGVKGPMSAVPEERLAGLELTAPDVKAPAIEDARKLRGGAGDKTKEFLVFVNENKESLPEEYARVKHLIERYL